MALEDGLAALGQAGNQQIEWAIGGLLRQRAERDDWRECTILRQLETGEVNLAAWNQLFQSTRESLSDEGQLRVKANTVLQPSSASFDLALDDLIAEMIAAMYLSELDHTNIRFLSEDSAITTDLMSVRDGITYVTEAKNLREPNSLAYVAFARWHHNRAAHPAAFNFSAEFLEIDQPFEDLDSAQINAVRKLVDALPQRQRPSTFLTTLPGNRKLRTRLSEGGGVMAQYGPGPFLVNEAVDRSQRALITKLLEPTRKALTQLYSTKVPDDYRRLLVFRWKPPDEIQAIGEIENVRTPVMSKWQAFIREFFPRFALAIVHTCEDVESTPKATW